MAKNSKNYGTFKYYDPSTRTQKTGKCAVDHVELFEGQYVYLDNSNDCATPRIRVGMSGPSAKALVLQAAGNDPWSETAKPRVVSRHIVCKNNNLADLRPENLIIGKTVKTL